LVRWLTGLDVFIIVVCCSTTDAFNRITFISSVMKSTSRNCS
jgi:hypothetical protein